MQKLNSMQKILCNFFFFFFKSCLENLRTKRISKPIREKDLRICEKKSEKKKKKEEEK